MSFYNKISTKPFLGNSEVKFCVMVNAQSVAGLLKVELECV